METIECIKTRRSIRAFKDTQIPKEIIDDILDCALKAPSGHNKQPWSFIVVTDKEKREQLSKVQKWSSFVTDAPVCIVPCMYIQEKEIFQPSMYFSMACAIENILLSVHDHGLGSCWTYVKDVDDPSVEEAVKKILDIPQDVEVICMLPIGYPAQEISGRSLKDSENLIHYDKW